MLAHYPVMKLRFSILLLALLFAHRSSCIAGETIGVTTNIETRFCEKGILSPIEISNVVALAKDCGIDRPVRISTDYLLPITLNWDYIIRVKGAEIKSGRRISYLSAVISRGTSDAPKFKSRGDFWVRRGDIVVHNLASFMVGDREIRIELDRTFPLAEADKIISAFTAKRFKYPQDQADWNETLEHFDPNGACLERSMQKGKYKITAGLCEIEFFLDDDTIHVVSLTVGMY